MANASQPERIGRYLVERLLGTGAFATVWLARDETLDARVAIKVLAENWAHDDDVRRRFTEEARILWRLDSDRIVRVHTVDELEDGRPYFVMDYADAGTLGDRMRGRHDAGQPYAVDEAVAISIGIAESLAVAHAAGVIHRDLKPSNVLFRRRESGVEQMVLADFGIARSLEAGRSTTISAGTPHYMAPEQTEGRADRGSDVYSAAAILYELLAGTVPFPYQSAGQVIRAQLTQPAPDIRTVRPDVPPALAAVLAQGLHADSAQRPATAEAWRDALTGGSSPTTAAAGVGDPGLTLGPEELAAARVAMVAGPASGPPTGPPSAPVSSPPSGPFGSPPPDPPGPPFGPPPGGRSARDRRRRRQILAGFLIVALFGGVGAIAAISSGSAGADVLRISTQAPGPNSWMGSFIPPSVSLPPLTPPSVPTVTTASTSSTGSTKNGFMIDGTTPGLYGGTRQLSVCDVKQLVSFLQDHADKAKAWADTQGISVAGIPTFVAGLTDAILRADTRVTNHGFTNGVANKIQSVLQAGTAVLVDPLGMPRVKCNCGNPLLAPKTDTIPKYKGDTWTGFNPTEVTIVQPGAQITKLVLIDVLSQLPFQRQVGTYGTADTNAPPGIKLYEPPGGLGTGGPGGGGATTAPPATESSGTTTPTTQPPTTQAAITDITSKGSVSATSTYSSEYPASLAVDGDPTTSWFSAGDSDPNGSNSIFTWTAPSDFVITQVIIEGNAQHKNPAFRSGFGFGSTELVVTDGGGNVTYDQSFAGPNGSTQRIVATPNAKGGTIKAIFKKHQDPTCGGISKFEADGRPA